MKDKKVKRKSGRKLKESGVPLTKRNYQLFGIASLIILAGYWALAQHPVDGFLTLTLAPLFLVIGYCVLIPLAIIVGNKDTKSEKT